jgi:hypothetical protein
MSVANGSKATADSTVTMAIPQVGDVADSGAVRMFNIRQ